MGYVFDTSFIGSIILPDEKNLLVQRTYSAIAEDEKIFIPLLFWYEISNLFMNLVRRKRFTFNTVTGFYPALAAIDLTIDSESGIAYSRKLLQLCGDCNLSSYDAAYLELAQRKKAVLCTLDEGLRAAANNCGVTTLK